MDLQRTYWFWMRRRASRRIYAVGEGLGLKSGTPGGGDSSQIRAALMPAQCWQIGEARRSVGVVLKPQYCSCSRVTGRRELYQFDGISNNELRCISDSGSRRAAAGGAFVVQRVGHSPRRVF